MTTNELILKLKEMLPEKRFRHSEGVANMAVKLAEFYGVDEEKARIAGLLHDCAKDMTDEEILKLVEKFDILIDDVQRSAVNIVHGHVGAEIARQQFGVTDNEILNAIRYHTTGKENMSFLDKIIYVADYIEPNRDFPGVDVLRKVSFIDIDLAVLLGIDTTINYIIHKNALIHPDTIHARNYMLQKNPKLDYRQYISS